MYNLMAFFCVIEWLEESSFEESNHFFYNYKRINPFCRFCDRFQYIYFHQSLYFFMECILEMSRYFLGLCFAGTASVFNLNL